MIGFSFRETMRGHFYWLKQPMEEKSLVFSLSARAGHLRRFLVDKTCDVDGHVDAEGLAEQAPLNGTLRLTLLDERRLPYRFTFAGKDGRTYEFRGQKDISVLDPVVTMTTLPASLYDDGGAEVARATVYFDVKRDLRSFLRSFRPELNLRSAR